MQGLCKQVGERPSQITYQLMNRDLECSIALVVDSGWGLLGRPLPNQRCIYQEAARHYETSEQYPIFLHCRSRGSCVKLILTLNDSKCTHLRVSLNQSHTANLDNITYYSLSYRSTKHDLGTVFTTKLSCYDSIFSEAYHFLNIIRCTISMNTTISTKKLLLLYHTPVRTP